MVYEQPLEDLAIGVAIDQDASRTKTVGAFSRKPAWHTQGTLVPEDMSVEQGLELAHMTKPVVKEKIMVPVLEEIDGDPQVTTLEAPGSVALVQEDPFTGRKRILNIVGKDYGVVQNRELGNWGHAILGVSGGAQLTSLGTFNNGLDVFMSLHLPKAIMVQGKDRIDLYLGLTNRHGGKSVQAVITPVRFECRNTTRAGLANAAAKMSIRHTSGVLDAMAREEEARRVLGLTDKYVTEFEAMMSEMTAIDFPDLAFDELIAEVYGPQPEKVSETKDGAARTIWDNRRDAIVAERRSESNAFAADKGYGAWNAITAYENWEGRVAGATPEEQDANRAKKVLMGGTDWAAEKAMAFVLARR